MTDVEITKSEPPALQFAKERQELIEWYTERLEQDRARIDAIEDEEERQQFIKSTKQSVIDMYFSLPYVEHYIYWNYDAFDNILTEEDIKIAFDVMSFSLRHEVVSDFIYTVHKRPFIFTELYNAYKDDPERAEQPLSDEEKELFTFFLDNVFRPAFVVFVQKAKNGLYRTTEEIGNDISIAFNNWVQDKSEENEKAYRRFTTEQFKSRNDFDELIRDYCEVSGFYIKISDKEETEPQNINYPSVTAHYPNNYVMNTTKAAHCIGIIKHFNDPAGVNVAKSNRSKGKKKQEPRVVSITLFPDKESDAVKLSRPISYRDKTIIDAAETLAECNEYITPAQIYRLMNGNNITKAPEKATEDIEARIDAMRRIMATVDYTEHMNFNGYEGEFIKEGHLLEMIKETVSLNGKTVVAYKPIAESPLYTYAKDVKQLLSIPLKMLDTKSVTNSNERTQNIKSYLLFRIYRTKEMSPTIIMSNLLQEIGEPNPSDKQLRNIRNTVEDLLYYWSFGKARGSSSKPNKEVLAASPIQNYSVNTKGKSITSFTVIPKVIAT